MAKEDSFELKQEIIKLRAENTKLKNENRNLRADIFLSENCILDIIERQKVIDNLECKIINLNLKIKKIKKLLKPDNLNKTLYYIDIINDIKKILNS